MVRIALLSLIPILVPIIIMEVRRRLQERKRELEERDRSGR